ncbi:heparan-alpha-glucosaminide N-acetyltransferase domain-containing protein [Saccharopolyspora sp. TS4A08]|uniref:Heparan-alpha-glucosaminide N-acetyltransferase domain-containing protein n=1 Tax=Saccharopolyspora ipomoeae TaxID=3042027 RepID=A0ABT6PSA7_9PSEU|nr:heparan-alpha-glucosaminide N-acetyltransferase domain-containing protein [Saccharopolyspora sp. TS4A08]MDI2030864.1 heparan-alpha-glucosaminide N-acetyltransferase domain-containing protein [Saccharopolyspora sp. TS4A08]
MGVDVARFVAVFGMFCIHFGVPFTTGLPEVWAAQFFSGRSTALFTLLAGVSLALMTGRATPPSGSALRDARLRVAVRAVALLVLGLALAKATEATGFLLTVIIPFYGLYFLLAVPFLRLRARGLVVAAAVSAAVGPQLSFVLRGWIAADTPLAGLVSLVNGVDPGHLLADEGLFDLLLLGFYPAASYLPLVLAGLAVGRMDLTSRWLRLRLGAVGLVLSLVGYQVSFLLVPVGPPAPVEGTIPVGHPEWLLAANAHSGTTFELLGSGGIALIVLALCLELADRTGSALTPLAKAGSMALTLYAAHALALSWQIVSGGWPLSGVPEDLAHLASSGPSLPDDPNLPWFPRDGHEPTGLTAFVNTFMPEVFLIFTFAFTCAWRRFFRRGPLEALVSDIVRAVTDRRPKPTH